MCYKSYELHNGHKILDRQNSHNNNSQDKKGIGSIMNYWLYKVSKD